MKSMIHEIRSLLRGAILAVAIATGATMLSATPGQAIPDMEGCGVTHGRDGDWSVSVRLLRTR